MSQPTSLPVRKKLPTAADFFINLSPYTTFDLNEWSYRGVLKIMKTKDRLDCFCIECNEKSIFVLDPFLTPKITFPPMIFSRDDIIKAEGFYERIFSCSRNPSHKLRFYIRLKNNQFTKIGQWPSLADISEYSIKKYRKVLGEFYTDYSK